MTNLQAIDLLKGLEQSLDDYCELNDEGKTAFGMAITALELFGNAEQLPPAQPVVISKSENTTECEDAVSRFEVLRLIDYSSHDLNDAVDNRYMQNEIKQLPSVTPKQSEWIPWDSGRFPEESGTYTVTAYDGAKRRVTYAKYQKRLKRWELTGARAYWKVLAWQPKPQPWEGGHDEGKAVR